METRRILFLGAGRMAQAIIAGIAANAKTAVQWQVLAANRSQQARLQHLREHFGVQPVAQWQQAVSTVDIVLLAIPPDEHPAVLRELAERVTPGQLIVSVAAGIGVSGLASTLPSNTQVAWVMPNIAAAIGESITLYAVNDAVSAEHHRLLTDILAGCGEFVQCSEQQIHALTAITGSAPAFIFRLAEKLEHIAQQTGLTEQQARKLVGQMLHGSAELLRAGQQPGILADEVATPGGATAAGLAVLAAAGFSETFAEAIAATQQKAQKLGRHQES